MAASSSSSFSSWMTHISQGVQIEISKLQSRGGSAMTRGGSVPAGWLCQPASCQRFHKMSLIGKPSVRMSLCTCSGRHFWKDTGQASGRRGARVWKGAGSSQGQSSAVITPTKVNHERWAHLFWLVSSRMVANLPPAADRTKSELLSHAPINGRLNRVERDASHLSSKFVFFLFCLIKRNAGSTMLNQKMRAVF